ncbi:MAG: cytochrome c [Campylobacteraceae bacterium]|jgi:mono/diheme cytochrome c family protein|nr:cytochrome c [Campylobacteraceae bacterium]
MKTMNCFKAAIILGSLFATSLFADGDPQLSISAGSYKFDAKSGEELYKASCQGCHMADGKGAHGAGFYPALGGNVRLMSTKTTVEAVVNGLRGMPSFRGYLSDEQVIEVVNYIRTHFGNNFKGTASAADIPK